LRLKRYNAVRYSMPCAAVLRINPTSNWRPDAQVHLPPADDRQELNRRGINRLTDNVATRQGSGKWIAIDSGKGRGSSPAPRGPGSSYAGPSLRILRTRTCRADGRRENINHCLPDAYHGNHGHRLRSRCGRSRSDPASRYARNRTGCA